MTKFNIELAVKLENDVNAARTAHKALQSNRMQSILSIVRAFNRAGVLATSLMRA